jgi:hypothetical protein
MTTNETKLSLIADRVQAARLRRTLLYRVHIGKPIPYGGGVITRMSQRSLRYEVDGVTVIQYSGAWKNVTRKMLEYLGAWSQADSERETEARERLADDRDVA